jgi:uroporphyrinogen decarboxylase
MVIVTSPPTSPPTSQPTSLPTSTLEPATNSSTALFLRALRGENTPRAPIWVMRQAGRYLPEYMALKAKSNFLEMVRTPELACEITLQPVRRFPLDAAIIFSDIMTPLPAMGVQVEFNPGPQLEPLRTKTAIDALRIPDQAEIAPFLETAIRLARHELQSNSLESNSPESNSLRPSGTPLIGFAGAPLTMAAYLIQGSGSKEFEDFRAFLRLEPALAHALLEKLTEVSIRYLKAQIAAGAQAIQLFDSWAGLHDETTYREFALPYNARVLSALEGLAPRIFLAVGAGHLYPVIRELPCEAVSVDWRTPLSRVRPLIPGKTLQGNLDPAALLGTPETLERDALRVLESGLGGAHVFNLGHGIFRQTNPDMLARLIEIVHAFERNRP